jgi:hypothetical protein
MVIIYLVALLLSVPLFIIVYPFVPELELPLWGGVRLDHVLTFSIILVAFAVLVRRFQLAIYSVLILGLLGITITSLLGIYGFGDLYAGYSELLNDLRRTTEHVPLAARQAKPFQDADAIRMAIRHDEPEVRKAAVRMATTHFTDVKVEGDEHTMVQAFSIFKEINSRWRYVSDVKGGEYFAPASESLELMAGDCDDHAILMAAAIKAIGGEVRLVRTAGHIYPEFKVGDDRQLERAAYLIRKVLFPKEVGDAPLYHHTDADGQHWINMDYTRRHPGGELMDERIVGVLEV